MVSSLHIDIKETYPKLFENHSMKVVKINNNGSFEVDGYIFPDKMLADTTITPLQEKARKKFSQWIIHLKKLP